MALQGSVVLCVAGVRFEENNVAKYIGWLSVCCVFPSQRKESFREVGILGTPPMRKNLNFLGLSLGISSAPENFRGVQGCSLSTEEVKYLVHFWNSKPLLTGFQSSLSHHDTQLGTEGACYSKNYASAQGERPSLLSVSMSAPASINTCTTSVLPSSAAQRNAVLLLLFR